MKVNKLVLIVLCLLSFDVLANQRATDFRARDFITKEKIQLSHLEGNVVAISFWATWCKPCIKELNYFKKIALKNEKFKVIAVATDGPETSAQIRGTVRKNKWSPVINVIHDRSGNLTSVYNPTGIVPFVSLIDRCGNLVYSSQGFSQGDGKKYKSKVESLNNNQCKENK